MILWDFHATFVMMHKLRAFVHTWKMMLLELAQWSCEHERLKCRFITSIGENPPYWIISFEKMKQKLGWNQRCVRVVSRPDPTRPNMQFFITSITNRPKSRNPTSPTFWPTRAHLWLKYCENNFILSRNFFFKMPQNIFYWPYDHVRKKKARSWSVRNERIRQCPVHNENIRSCPVRKWIRP